MQEKTVRLFTNMTIKQAQIKLGITSFRDPQEKIIKSIIKNETTLALLPTGYGKSICYQIPGLIKTGYTLVISPLIALMDDQVFHLRQKNISAIALHSNQTLNQTIFLNLFEKKHYKFIYLSPEKLLLSNQTTIFKKNPPSLIALDEAHCFSIWGNDFRPIYKQLPNYISQLKPTPAIALFTATASKKVTHDLIVNFKIKRKNIFTGDFFRKNLFIIHQQFFLRSQKFLYLCYLIFHKYKNLNGLIYCITRKETAMIFQALKKMDFYNQLEIDYFHAGRTKKNKTLILEKFLNKKLKILVTTNAFGLGVDKDDLNYVIHYQVPDQLENYVQEIGRAGRNGKLACCELLVHQHDFEINLNLSKNKTNLKIMKNFVNNNHCHHQKILNFFGQKTTRDFNCRSCNLCSPSCELVNHQLKKRTKFLSSEIFINQQQYLFNYEQQPHFFHRYNSVGTGYSQVC
ncbi:MAG: RecQ family ATP-dependent DNA helicase [Patescibacteria group bacterium]